MFVKSLIGRMAGAIIDLPFVAATSGIASGTCQAATDEEVRAAGFAETPPTMVAGPIDGLAPGYVAEVTEVGGYDLRDPGGVRLNQEPYPNIAAALSASHDHFAAMRPAEAVMGLAIIPRDPAVSVPTITLDQYRFEALEGGGIAVFDPAGIRLRDEAFADDDTAFDAARAHYAASRGLTLDQLDAEEAGPTGGDAMIDVPADWKGLHHKQRRALAQRITGKPVANTSEADEVIEEYVTRPR